MADLAEPETTKNAPAPAAPEPAESTWPLAGWVETVNSPTASPESLAQNAEFLAAAKDNYEMIYGEGAWETHIAKTRADLEESAAGWTIFSDPEAELAAFDANARLAEWGIKQIQAQQTDIDWSNAGEFGIKNPKIFYELDSQTALDDSAMADLNAEFGKAWLNASEILYNAKNGENAWAERVAEKGWDTDTAAQKLAGEGEAYLSWFQNNLVSAGKGMGIGGLSAEGQVALLYLSALNDRTKTTAGDLASGFARGLADPTMVASVGAGFFSFGTGTAAGLGARTLAQQGLMAFAKDLLASRATAAIAARAAISAMGEGAASEAAMALAEQKMAVDNALRDDYNWDEVKNRAAMGGLFGAALGGVLAGGGTLIVRNVDFGAVLNRINIFKSGNADAGTQPSAAFQEFENLFKDINRAKLNNDTDALTASGQKLDEFLAARGDDLTDAEKAFIANESQKLAPAATAVAEAAEDVTEQTTQEVTEEISADTTGTLAVEEPSPVASPAPVFNNAADGMTFKPAAEATIDAPNTNAAPVLNEASAPDAPIVFETLAERQARQMAEQRARQDALRNNGSALQQQPYQQAAADASGGQKPAMMQNPQQQQQARAGTPPTPPKALPDLNDISYKINGTSVTPTTNLKIEGRGLPGGLESTRRVYTPNVMDHFSETRIAYMNELLGDNKVFERLQHIQTELSSSGLKPEHATQVTQLRTELAEIMSGLDKQLAKLSENVGQRNTRLDWSGADWGELNITGKKPFKIQEFPQAFRTWKHSFYSYISPEGMGKMTKEESEAIRNVINLERRYLNQFWSDADAQLVDAQNALTAGDVTNAALILKGLTDSADPNSVASQLTKTHEHALSTTSREENYEYSRRMSRAMQQDMGITKDMSKGNYYDWRVREMITFDRAANIELRINSEIKNFYLTRLPEAQRGNKQDSLKEKKIAWDWATPANKDLDVYVGTMVEAIKAGYEHEVLWAMERSIWTINARIDSRTARFEPHQLLPAIKLGIDEIISTRVAPENQAAVRQYYDGWLQDFARTHKEAINKSGPGDWAPSQRVRLENYFFKSDEWERFRRFPGDRNNGILDYFFPDRKISPEGYDYIQTKHLRPFVNWTVLYPVVYPAAALGLAGLITHGIEEGLGTETDLGPQLMFRGPAVVVDSTYGNIAAIPSPWHDMALDGPGIIDGRGLANYFSDKPWVADPTAPEGTEKTGGTDGTETETSTLSAAEQAAVDTRRRLEENDRLSGAFAPAASGVAGTTPQDAAAPTPDAQQQTGTAQEFNGAATPPAYDPSKYGAPAPAAQAKPPAYDPSKYGVPAP